MSRRLSLIAVFFMLLLLVAPLPAKAVDVFNVDCNSGSGVSKDNTSSSAVCSSKVGKDAPNPLTGSNGALINIASIISIIAGAAAIIIIIVGSLRYVTSGGDSAKITSAKHTVLYALIGIAVIVLARALIGFVLSKLP